MAQIINNISTPNDGLGDSLRKAFDQQNQMNTELYARNGSNIYATNPSTLAQEPIDDILEIFPENLADENYITKIAANGSLINSKIRDDGTTVFIKGATVGDINPNVVWTDSNGVEVARIDDRGSLRFSNAYLSGVVFPVNQGFKSTSSYLQFLINAIEDAFESKGIINYKADYSASYNARSLVDKAYVDSVASGGSITDVTLGTAINGFTAETIVDADSLTFSDFSDSNKAKKISFSGLKTILNTIYTTASYVTSALATFKTDNFLDATSSIQTQLNSKQTARVVETILTTGTTTLDFAYSSFNKITQTGNIVIDGTNLTGTKFIEKSILIQGSENATHTFTLPNNWKNISGVSPDSTKINYFEFNLINGSIVYSVNKYDIPDVTAPTLLKSSILLDAMNTIELLYSEAIDASVTTQTSWYTVAGKTVSSVTIISNKVRVVVSVPFVETDTPTVTFTNQVVGAGIQDASGNKAPDFSQNIGLTTYRTDNFNRADSTISINSPSDAGSDWVTPFGAIWGIASNKAYCFGANTSSAIAHAVFLETNESNVILRKKVTYGTTGIASSAFMIRYVDNNNHYLVQFGKISSSGQLFYSILKLVGGTFTTVVANTNYQAWVSGTEYTFMAKCSGNVITLYNGTTVLTQITDNSLPTGTKHGIRIFSGSGSTGNNDRYDDFGVYYG